MKQHKIGKSIFITITSIVLAGIVTCICLFLWGRPILKSNLKYWQKSDYSEFGSDAKRLVKLLPTYEENDNFNDAKFYYHKGLGLNYANAAYCLELDLNEQEFNIAKENALQSHIYLEEIYLKSGNITADGYKVGNYDVCIINVIDSVSNNFKIEKFPAEIALIAFNNSVNRIRYCYITDESLDYFESKTDFNKWITKNIYVKW